MCVINSVHCEGQQEANQPVGPGETRTPQLEKLQLGFLSFCAQSPSNRGDQTMAELLRLYEPDA